MQVDPYRKVSVRPKEILPEVYVSVDTETSGPTPATANLIAIGATALIGTDSKDWPRFYVTLKPRLPRGFDSEYMAFNDLDRTSLMSLGEEPLDAMKRFHYWLQSVAKKVVFVGYNAPFDWMFVAFYFDHYLEENPFGHNAVNIPDLGVGLLGSAHFKALSNDIKRHNRHPHDALSDAINQGELFRQLSPL